MQTKSASFWGRSQFLSFAVVAGAGVLTQVACSGTEQPVDAPFESAVTKHDLAGGKAGAPGAGAPAGMDPYCAILQVANNPHPPHGCHPTACEACQNLAWKGLCDFVEHASPVVIEKYFGLAAGLTMDFGLMWASILNVFATHASDFLCGPNSQYGMDAWMQNKCYVFGDQSQECQAAKIAYTCSCMGDSNARATNESIMTNNCGYCGCYKSRKYTGGDDQLAGGMACLKKGLPRTGRGRTYGDPNLTSFDGVRIADNRAGEFVGVRRIAGQDSPPVEVHFRYEPWGGSQVVSQVTAVAVKAGSTRVAVYAGSPPTIRVNGDVVEVPEEGFAANDFIDVYAMGAGYTSIALPSGDVLTVTGVGAMLNVSVELTEEQLGHVEGVLGLWDQDVSDEPWQWGPNQFRVTSQADSLFDYAAGESFATYDDPGFPHMNWGPPGGPSPMVAQAALAQCAGAGIVDPNVLDGCVHDMTATNLEAPEFVVAAAAMDLEISGLSPLDAIPPEMNADPGAGAGSGGAGAGGAPSTMSGTTTSTMSGTTSSTTSSMMFGMGGFPSP